MTSFTTINLKDYEVSIIPIGNRRKCRWPKITRPFPFYFAQLGESSNYYWLPYFNGQDIDLILQAKAKAKTKLLVALHYKWKWYFVKNTKRIFVTDGEGELTGGNKNGEWTGILNNGFIIPFRYVVDPESYQLDIQISERNEIILDWMTMANFDIWQWKKFLFSLFIAAIGLLGVILGVLGTLLGMLLEKLMS
ncbi:MAG: hypothetical protein JXB43_00050 [Dehalococcoidia bacterium]|nr:hypothetical protein [Dehalococcoidia bacterium]